VRDEIPTSPTEHAHGALTAQATSVNRGATAGGYVALPFGHVGGGHLALRAEGSARTGGDLRTPVGSLGNTDLRTYNGSASLALVGERGHAGVAYRAYANDYGIPGGFIGAHPNGVDVAMRRPTPTTGTASSRRRARSARASTSSSGRPTCSSATGRWAPSPRAPSGRGCRRAGSSPAARCARRRPTTTARRRS
jgi:hypothetical protein